MTTTDRGLCSSTALQHATRGTKGIALTRNIHGNGRSPRARERVKSSCAYVLVTGAVQQHDAGVVSSFPRGSGRSGGVIWECDDAIDRELSCTCTRSRR